VRKSIGFLSLMCLAAAGALAGSAEDNQVLAAARQSQLEFRQGNPQVIGPLVKSLEAAVARSPDNPDLWQELGHAYMAQQGSLFESSADPGALIAVGKRGRDAYARALALDKNDVLVQASHGMARMGIATLEQNPSELMAAVEEMNAAVRQAPKSTVVRLTRGFTTIHLPVSMRDTAAVVEDLRFVMDTAPGGRAEDVLHVLLGDVYAETGKLEEARRDYEQVSGASRFAAEQSRARLGDLKKGAVSPADIGLVRAGTGSKCAMCHAPGTDD
jgi:tetratricopeptide (TPR) repeat protein